MIRGFDAATLPSVALLAAAAAAALLVYLYRPPASRATLLAALPWLVAAAPLHVLRRFVGYPPSVRPAFASPRVFLLLGSLYAGTWLLLSELVSADQVRQRVPHYLGLIGVGAAIAPLGLFVATYGTGVAPERLLAWALMPVVACIVTYLALAGLWVGLPRTASFAGVTGALLLFGLTLHGAVMALGLALGGWSPSLAVAFLAERVVAALDIGWRPALVWAVVWSRLLAALALILGLAVVSRWHAAAGERGLDAATAVSVVVSSETFVLALAGGVIA